MGKSSPAPPTYAAPGSGMMTRDQWDRNNQGGNPFDRENRWKQYQDSGGKSPWQGAAEGQAAASHVNQNGVVGSSSWSQDPKTGQWTQSQSVNGPLAGAAQGYQNQIANQAPLDFSGLPQLDYGADARKQAEDASYNQAKSRLDPQFAQQEEHMRAQLASQGLDPGSQAANADIGNFDRGRNDAYASAQNYSVGQGLQAQQQAFGQSQMARQQALGEMLKQRGMPMEQLQQIMAMMGGAQGVGQAGGPNYLGAMQGQAGFNTDSADMNNKAAGQTFNAIGQAGAAAITLSDERAKMHIERLPLEVVDGVPFAIFEYRHAPGRKYLGVIAQDVLRVRPRLVHERRDGLLCVDYGGLQ